MALIFWTFLKLGLTSFGGPVAHLGFFRREFVDRRGWFDDRTYGDLVALCQFLPGPASSQVGFAVGLLRGGLGGGLAAWAGFTLPSALFLAALGLGVIAAGEALSTGVIAGLKLMAAAVVAQALWQMAASLAPDVTRRIMALLTGAVLLAATVLAGLPGWLFMVPLLIFTGLTGWLLLKPETQEDGPETSLDPRLGIPSWLLFTVFFVLLAGALFAPLLFPDSPVAFAAAFYNAGALVFGGGHVVLPLLETAIVPVGWVDRDSFLAGYGAAQTVPGPLFTFSAFLGGAADPATAPLYGLMGAAVALGAIFLPGLLLVTAALPLWSRLRGIGPARAALMGVNAGVVGLLAAALIDPILLSAVTSPLHGAVGLALLALLTLTPTPVWAVAIISALTGFLLL